MLINKENKDLAIFLLASLDSDSEDYSEKYYYIKDNELKGKILKNYPYFNFVLDEDGNLIDVTPTEVPEPESIIINDSVDEEKIAMAEAIIDLNMRIEELENKLNGGA